MKQLAKYVITATATLGVLVLGASAFAYSGVYDIGADARHTKPVYALLETLRDHSIERRAASIQVPDLSDPALIRQGAGNYAAMCTGCHLSPGMQASEMSKGLYPSPPALADEIRNEAAHDFWVIKHGIKASGMPAWGKSMQDQYVWGIVAFVQELPKLNAAQYAALVGSSGGHSHGGGESMPHDDGDADQHDGATEDMHMQGMGTDESKPHAHPAGTPAHVDPAPVAPAAIANPVDDGHHDHQH